MYDYWVSISYVCIIVAALISLIASVNVKRTFAKYSRLMSARGITAEEAAQAILSGAELYVPIRPIAGNLTDHYNPKTKELGLSQTVYGSTSVAAIGVAAHECGHAIQDSEEYFPMKIRGAIVPLANFGSRAAWPLVVFGLLFSFSPLISIGIFLFSLAVLFQLITLPVEFNASRRAVAILESRGILGTEELRGAKKVLSAAACTYLAAAATSILQLLRLLLIRRSSRD